MPNIKGANSIIIITDPGNASVRPNPALMSRFPPVNALSNLYRLGQGADRVALALRLNSLPFDTSSCSGCDQTVWGVTDALSPIDLVISRSLVGIHRDDKNRSA